MGAPICRTFDDLRLIRLIRHRVKTPVLEDRAVYTSIYSGSRRRHHPLNRAYKHTNRAKIIPFHFGPDPKTNRHIKRRNPDNLPGPH